MRCLVCGKEIEKPAICFIETDSVVCQECSKEIAEDAEAEWLYEGD